MVRASFEKAASLSFNVFTSAFNLSVRELNSFSNFLLLSIVCGAYCKILST